MTSQSPRIYIYKITFEEVLYYYYGVHKEKKFDEYYMGSPYTHKWCWDFYTPKKQILQLFDVTNEGWLEAQKVEKRLIKPFYNTDKWCLNEHCGGEFSIEHQKRAGKNGGNRAKELGIGIHSLTSQEKSQNGKKAKELGVGIFSMDADELSTAGKKGGSKSKELGVGVHSQTKEQMTKNGKIGGKIAKELKLGFNGFTTEQRKEHSKKLYENGIGIASLSKEQLKENAKKSHEIQKKNKTGIYSITKEEKRETMKKTNQQRWECCETGYVSTAAGVVSYQKGRGIDTSKSNRRRIS